MAAQRSEDWVGVYLPEDEGAPVALFRDSAHVGALVHQHLGRTDAVIAPADSMAVHPGLRDQFRDAATARSAAGPDPLAPLRGQIRTEVTREAVREQIEAEVRQELGLPARPGAPRASAATAERLGMPHESAKAAAK